MILVNGYIKTNPADVQRLYADLASGIERTMKEDGCIFYDFAISDPAQGKILVAERWRDEESLAAHLSTPEIGELMGGWQGKIEVDVKKFDLSNERGFG